MPDTTAETWKAIPGFDAYEASAEGHIRRVRGGRGTRPVPYVLTPVLRKKDGYLQVNPCQNGRRRTQMVHWLVAAAFLGPRPDGREVDHRDGVRHNCGVANLRYLTGAENKRAAAERVGRPWNQRPRRSPKSDPILQRLFAPDIETIRARVAAGESQSQVARDLGVSQPHVSRIVNGKRCTRVA